MRSFAGLLAELFPELESSAGFIESPLVPVPEFQRRMASGDRGRWLVKADHALPVVGSIKARGGFYEVLAHAEELALRAGVLKMHEDRRLLATQAARAAFAPHTVSVGSTGNLGLSIGVMSAALGFRATVHMSLDAKEWKKARLRGCGVTVIEHAGDFGAAVAAGRDEAQRESRIYFVDDEDSERLFLGYSIAAFRLVDQLIEQGIRVDEKHPLFVYLPCGVGGAPGGITFGLRHLLGDHVHCFFAEPVAAPCMLIRLASTDDRPIAVGDVGIDRRTEADGLAVGQASEFVVPLVRVLVSGVFTVPDNDLFADLYLLESTEGLRIEPSAAAGLRGPRWVLRSESGHRYLEDRSLSRHMKSATHILWTTGGSLVPDDEYRQFHNRGRIELSAGSAFRQ
jgi:D-serine dehydratase